MRHFGIIGLAMLLIWCGIGATRAQDAPAPVAPRWDPATVEAFARLPIQDQGRIKPFSTFARFDLVKLSGKTTFKPPSGERLSATEWMMDTLFHPQVASFYKVVRVENPALMQALGLPDDKKRAHFSFAELRAVEDRLLELARQFSEIEDKQRTLFQRGTLNLYDCYIDLGRLLHAFEFSRFELDESDKARLRGWFPEMLSADTPLDFATLVPLAPMLLDKMHQIHAAHGDAGHGEDANHAHGAGGPMENEVETLLEKIDTAASIAVALTMIPKASNPGDEWLSPGTMLREMVTVEKAPIKELDILRVLQELPRVVEQPAEFHQQVERLRGLSLAAINDPQLERKLGLEIFFYEKNFFHYALVLYVLSFVLVALSWLAPQGGRLGRALGALLPWTVVVPTALLIAGITLRCIIRGRPPVSTLYETTLFVPAVAIVAGLITEFINRRRIALAISSFLGVVGMFLANTYELKDGADTMTSLIAVLDSNFWLATHVTTVTIGYSAGLLAAALAHIYIFSRVFGLRRNDPIYYRNVTRMVYGVVCFGALFSFVGTVLGGVWANYSWGRFWGWDPKENGALMIILWNLIILHARLGGYVRDLGVCMLAIIGGIIVSFSWWGVNLLGVGLHSYGFTSGIARALFTFCAIEVMMLFFGMAAWVIERQGREIASRRQAEIGREAAT